MLRNLYMWLKRNFILPHIIFWVVSIVLFAVLLVYTRDFNLSGIDLKTTLSFFLTILFLAVSVYINILLLIPEFLKKRRFLPFMILEAGNIVLFILFNYFISFIFEDTHPNFLNEAIAEGILVTLFLVVTTLLTFTRDAMALQDARILVKEAERQKIEAELRALKSQVNPHFFFNTLNSLYSLSLDKSDKTPEMILKLSELMRYLIYETRDGLLPISKQLEFIKNYIYLERVRMSEEPDLRFEIRGDYQETPVDPLLFISFVENAFKHGTRKGNEKPWFRIYFDLSDEKRIMFRAENNYDHNNHVTGGSQGIGLANARKRLDLLYPGKYELDISGQGGKYIVCLELSVR